MKIQTVAVDTLDANPFRVIEHYPLVPEKLAELKTSIKESGFWTNVCARPKAGERGRYEIAYGHHRIAAARELKLAEVDIVVEDMDDETMFTKMKLENSETYGVSAYSDAGAIEGLLLGFVDGRLDLKRAHDAPTTTVFLARRDGKSLRIIGPGGTEVKTALDSTVSRTSAPGGPTSGVCFTRQSIADRLGWTKERGDGTLKPTERFDRAFGALQHLILPGAVEPETLAGLRHDDVMTAVKAAREAAVKTERDRITAESRAALSPSPKALRELEAARMAEVEARKAAAAKVINEVRNERTSSDVQRKRVREAVSAARAKRPQAPPLIQVYAEQTITYLSEMDNPYDPVLKRVQRMLPYLDDLDEVLARKIGAALRRAVESNGKRVLQVAEAFESYERGRVKRLVG